MVFFNVDSVVLNSQATGSLRPEYVAAAISPVL